MDLNQGFFSHNLVKELESVITLHMRVISIGDSYWLQGENTLSGPILETEKILACAALSNLILPHVL